MLIPRFSIRWLLLATAAAGMIAYVLAQAVAGKAWGIGVTVALAALLVTAVVHAVVFVFALGIAAVAAPRQPRSTSPFATHVPPPQLLLPEDPD